MAAKPEDSTNVMAFDALYTNNQIQKMKILLPYIDPAMQKHLAVYIKYLELQYTIEYVRKHPFQICGCSLGDKAKPDIQELCRQLCLYSSPEEIKQLEQIKNMIRTMETFQEMSQTFTLMKELFPDMDFGMDGASFSGTASDNSSETSSSENSGPSMMDMLMNMLTPEQKKMYEMFQNKPL